MKNTYRVYIAFLVFLAGIIASAVAQQSVKVMFIGNSFTYVHDLPGTFKSLASAGGKTVYVDDYTVGGAQFAGTSGLANTAAVYNLMRSQAWDYVVLQDNQGAFAGYQNQVSSTNMLANLRLRDSVRAQHPCARVIWFTGWGPKDGVFAGDNFTLELNRIDSNYQYMQNMYPAKKEIMAPFGKAWIASMNGQPSINLYETDDCHPGMAGQLLNASVLYTTIFKQDPSNINYTAGLSPASASFLRTTGYHTVITPYIYNSHVMPTNTPVVTNNAGVLTAPSGYSGYQWFLNNTPISGATSSAFTPATPGSYCVMATGVNGCAQNLSFPIIVTAATGIAENNFSEKVILYPNPVTDISVFELRDMDWAGGAIEIANVFGQTVLSQMLSSGRFTISKNDLGSGVYFYRITDRNGNAASGKINVL